jgi:hypothetical protein
MIHSLETKKEEGCTDKCLKMLKKYIERMESDEKRNQLYENGC